MGHTNLKLSIIHYSDYQRAILISIFNEFIDFELVYSGNFIKNFQDGIFPLQSEVVLLSEKQFGKEIFEIIDELQNINPQLKIVILIDELTYPISNILLKGIKFVLSESNLNEEVNLFLENFKRDEPYISSVFTINLLDIILSSKNRKEELFYLPEKTFKTLELLAKGQSYEAIADTLNMSLDSVRFHIKKIYGELKVKNKVAAVNKLYSEKIVIGVRKENRGRKRKVKLEVSGSK